MKISLMKKTVLALAGVMVIGSAGLAASAQESTPEKDISIQSEEREQVHEKARRSMEKWNALTDEQKAEFYSLAEQRIQADRDWLNKLVELGLMDQDMADNMQQHRQELFEKQKADGAFPFMGSPHRHQKTGETTP